MPRTIDRVRTVTPALTLAVILAAAATACGGEDAPTTPTAPTVPANVTVTFSGTVARNGANTHPFTTDGGTVTAIISALSPDSTAVLGLVLGTWNGSSCQTVIANDRATQGTPVIGTASGSGELCIRLYDATGALAGPTAYQVQVVHPQRS
jgi:hypothetical protein